MYEVDGQLMNEVTHGWVFSGAEYLGLATGIEKESAKGERGEAIKIRAKILSMSPWRWISHHI